MYSKNILNKLSLETAEFLGQTNGIYEIFKSLRLEDGKVILPYNWK